MIGRIATFHIWKSLIDQGQPLHIVQSPNGGQDRLHLNMRSKGTTTTLPKSRTTTDPSQAGCFVSPSFAFAHDKFSSVAVAIAIVTPYCSYEWFHHGGRATTASTAMCFWPLLPAGGGRWRGRGLSIKQVIHTTGTSPVQWYCHGSVLLSKLLLRRATRTVHIMEPIAVTHSSSHHLGHIGLVIAISNITRWYPPMCQQSSRHTSRITVPIPAYQQQSIEGGYSSRHIHGR